MMSRIKFTMKQGWRDNGRRKHERRAAHLRRLMPSVYHANSNAAQTYSTDINDAVHEVMLLPQDNGGTKNDDPNN